MQLYKETFKVADVEYYIKEYNDKGLLILENIHHYGTWSTKKISYDEQNRISKIREHVKSKSEDCREEQLLHVYKYSRQNYRITTYLTHKCDANEYATNEWILDGIQVWTEIDQLVSVKEYKIENISLISERHYDIRAGKNYSLTCVYEDGKIILETITNLDGSVNNTCFSYEQELLLSKDFYKKGQHLHKIMYIYKDNLLEEEQKIHLHNEIEYISSTTKYFYNSKSEVIKIEHHGRFDSKLYLCKVDETIYENNSIIKKGAAIPGYENLIGHFDLNSLNQEKIENYKYMFEQYGTSDFNPNETEEIKLKETFFENLDLENIYLTIEVFDNNNNLTEYKRLDPDNQDLIIEKLVYHN